MIDTDRVISMTKMAAYEKRQGKKDMAVTSYFRSDYISMQIIISMICITAAFCIGCAVCILLNFEVFMQDIYNMDLMTMGRQLLIKYAVVSAVYVAVTYFIYTVRYHFSHRRIRRMEEYLKWLDKAE